MITQEMFPELIRDFLRDGNLEEIINEPNDYIWVQTLSSNFGYRAAITSVDYSEEDELAAGEEGDLYCDKDSFVRILEEYGIDYSTHNNKN